MQYAIPSCEEFRRGYEKFRSHEKRDAVYKVATFLVNHWWGKPAEMADAIGVLLLTWNYVFYNRFGIFEFSKLEEFLERNIGALSRLRKRHIRDLTPNDEKEINGLFTELLEVLKAQSENHANNGRKSPVSVAKALHLLAPTFFPLWDNKIAKAYSVGYTSEPAKRYFKFCLINKDLEKQLGLCIPDSETFLKCMDEYNFAKYTKSWV